MNGKENIPSDRADAESSADPSARDADLDELLRHVGRLPADKRRVLARELQQLERADRTAAKRTSDERRAEALGSRPLRSAVSWSILALLAFFLVDAAIFRSGWYLRYLEPNSSAGIVESYMHWLAREKPSARPEVMVIGDSRIAEGFSVRDAMRARSRFYFWNFGIGGTSPRDWYYILRDADPGHHRFAAIVLALDRYTDRDSGDNLADRLSDENYVIGRLRLTDCPEFSQSFSLAPLRRYALRGCLFKGFTLRQDLFALLPHFKDRMERSRDWRDNGLGYISGYGGKPEDLNGLSVNWEKRTIAFPPGALDWQRNTVKSSLTPDPFPQTGALTRYREYWFGKIFRMYAGTSTRVILAEYPRGPLPAPEDGSSPAFITSARRTPGVTVLPESTFSDLEQPQLFADGLHLNHAGRPIFSQRLASQVSQVLGAR